VVEGLYDYFLSLFLVFIAGSLPHEAVGEAFSFLKVAFIRRDIFAPSSLFPVRGDWPTLEVRGPAALFVDVIQAEPVGLLLALVRRKHFNVDLMWINHSSELRSPLAISAALHVFSLKHDYEGATIDIVCLLLRAIKLGLSIRENYSRVLMHGGLALDYRRVLSELRALGSVDVPMLTISGLLLLQLVEPVEFITIGLDGGDFHV